MPSKPRSAPLLALIACAVVASRPAQARTTCADEAPQEGNRSPRADSTGEPSPADAGALDAAPTAPFSAEDAGLDDDALSEGPEEEASLEEPDELPLDAGYRYTRDLSDRELARRWKEDPASLGSISVGRPEEGRLINARPFPEAADGGAWIVVIPESCWTTQETADAITGAATQLREWFPEGAPVRVGQVSGREGGYLWPHITHQNGRDIDIGLFYPGPEPYRVKEREKVMDVPMNWAFAKAMLTHGDVQYILLDKRVQKVLYDYALKHGEDKAWLDALFSGPRAVFRHARKHRDHFHFRLWNPRAQELAHRIAPLLPSRPDENVAFHRVKKGDTLGGIAVKYGSSVKKLKETNRLANNFLKLGQVLRVQLRGPCTSCPVPPLVVVPPRRVPPAAKTSAASGADRPQG